MFFVLTLTGFCLTRGFKGRVLGRWEVDWIQLGLYWAKRIRCRFSLGFGLINSVRFSLGVKDVKAEFPGTNPVIYEIVFQGPFLTSWDSRRTIEAYLT